MSLLSMAQEAAAAIRLPKPTRIIMAADLNAQQFLVAANDEGRALVRRAEWSFLTTEAAFTTVPGQSDYSLATIAPGYKRMISQTVFNRSRRERLIGPQSPQDWQLQKAWPEVNTIFKRFRVQGGVLKIFPTPTEPEDAAFEYVSKNWVVSADGLLTCDSFAADTDTVVFDEGVFQLGIRWRMLKMLGMDYQDSFAEWTGAVSALLSGDGGGAPVLKMAGPNCGDINETSRVGINWNSLDTPIDQL